jgi:AbrB family looped-hinge helix DNA binding protein
MPERRKNGSITQDNGKFMSSVKVGPKGQVVIPKEAREMFGINPGDTLLLLADAKRGIALHRFDYFDRIADEIFLKASDAPEGSAEREDGMKFVQAVKTAKESAQEEKTE